MLNMGVKVSVSEFGCLSDIDDKNQAIIKLRFATIWDVTALQKNKRNLALAQSQSVNVSFYKTVDMIHSHHSTSFLSASPPSRLQAWYTASLRVQNASLFALFDSSVDDCHIWRVLANSTTSTHLNVGLAVKQELGNLGTNMDQTKWGVYAKFYLQI